MRKTAAEFEYRHEFVNKPVGEVHGAIVRWLGTEGAKVSRDEAPNLIEAVHGSLKTISVWKRDAKKKLTFDILAKREGSEVVLKASPGSIGYADDVGRMRQEIFVGWGLLAEEIWAFVEGRPAAPAVSEFNYAKEELSAANRVQGRKMMLYGGLVLLVGILVIVLAILAGFLGAFPVIIPVFGVLLTFWGAVKSRWGR